jgi:NAD(P)-dependent dehydrogenase (short-subunit alcohol dehydrogenase family)
MRFDVAVVQGASGSLGRAIVDTFVARGDHVVAVSRRPEGSADQPSDVSHEAVDVSDAAQVEALWDRLEERGARPRWLVNAVGGYRGGTVSETDPVDLRFMHSLNLESAWWSSREAAWRMEAGGAIVNVAARSALTGGSRAAAYSVAKAGVVRLTELLAAELAERRVRANAILPSTIDTPANREAMSADKMRDAVAPSELAAVIAFLCSDAASAVTGAVVPVYGWV